MEKSKEDGGKMELLCVLETPVEKERERGKRSPQKKEKE